MQPWPAPSQARLLADVKLGPCTASAAAVVAWCPVSGLLAVGARLRPDLACVHLLSPHFVQRKATLAVPLQGPEDDLVCVEWSPVGCRRVLLTATRSGSVSAWSQHIPPPSVGAQQADAQFVPVLTLGDWACQSVGQVTPAQPAGAADSSSAEAHSRQADPPSLLSLQWLQPPSRWPNSNRPLQQHDFQAGSVPNMFAPAAPSRRVAANNNSSAPSDQQPAAGSSWDASSDAPGQDLFHWVQPGTLAFTAVLSSGQAVVGWATWAAQGQLKWQLTPGVQLVTQPPAAAAAADTMAGTPASNSAVLLAADAAVSADGVVVVFTTQQQPDQVQVVELQGNPLYHQCLSAALRSQRAAFHVVQLVSCRLLADAGSGSSRVRCLSWDPHSNGQRLVAAAGPTSSSGDAATTPGSTSPGQLTLLKLSQQPQEQQQEQQQQAAPSQTYVLAPVGTAQVSHVPAGPRQCAWLLEGLLVSQQLLDADNLTQLQLSFPQPAAAPAFLQRTHIAHSSLGGGPSQSGTALSALAPSPHRVAVAAVTVEPTGSSSSSSSGANGGNNSSSGSQHQGRLLLYSIPPVSKAADAAMAPTLASRLLWSLLLQLHAWDLVQHVVHAAQPQQEIHSTAAAATAGDAALQAERVAQVLSLVDKKLAVQPDELYSTYAVRWDGLKYAVVSRTPGGEARALSIDIRLRQLVPVLEVHLAAAAREDDQRQATASSQQSSQQARPQQQPGSSNAAAITEYMAAVLDFVVACVSTWLSRRVAAAAAAAAASGSGTSSSSAAEAAVKAVPCIRHLLDFRTSTKLAAFFSRAADMSKLTKVCRSWGVWKQLNKAVDGTTEQPANWEDMLLDVVPGPFELHPQHPARAFPPCLFNFRLPAEQLLRHLQSLPDWQQVPVLSDADITAMATRLGLLPVKTQQAKDHFERQMQQHLRFRQQPLPDQLGVPIMPPAGPPPVQASTAAGKRGAGAAHLSSKHNNTTAAKRCRWERQLRDVMGSTVGPAAVCSAEVIDFVHMSWGSPAGLAMQSVDGSVVAREVLQESTAAQPSAADGRAAQRRPANVTNNWVYTCPLTAEMWLLAPASATAAEMVL